MAKGVYLPSEIFESKACMKLGGMSLYVLIIIMSKRRLEKVSGKKTKKKTWSCTNPDDLCFTYVEALKKFGIKKDRLIRAIDDLLAKGFLRQTHQGGACKRDKSTYALSDKFLMWKPGTTFEKRAFDTVARGYRKPAASKINARENATHTLARKHDPKGTLRVAKTRPKEGGPKLAKSRSDTGFDSKDE
jgi:hypothetical protein